MPRVPFAPPPSSPAVRAVMRANSVRETRPERVLRSALHQRGLRFRKHVALLERGRCRPDVVFPRQRVAVFVDGCFWHGCPQHGTRPTTNSDYWSAKITRNVGRDREHDLLLGSLGWHVIRIWEHEDVEAAADWVERVLSVEA
ncbi:MAG: very short patch repair endonuclease [Actinobacteria bacterium]|nr:MAG: very short patch repair endonuclease [Actinomycetota bacterium]